MSLTIHGSISEKLLLEDSFLLFCVFFQFPKIFSFWNLLQISGKRDVTKRALYEVSTLLHQNPRKDKPPLSFFMPHASQNFPPSALPPSNSMWSHRNFSPHDSPPMPWMNAHRNRLSGIGPGSFSSIPPAVGAEASAEFSMKILCPAGKIGGVIGKGGFNVKQLQQETGAGIHVEDASTESDERVIRVSGIEVNFFYSSFIPLRKNKITYFSLFVCQLVGPALNSVLFLYL